MIVGAIINGFIAIAALLALLAVICLPWVFVGFAVADARNGHNEIAGDGQKAMIVLVSAGICLVEVILGSAVVADWLLGL